MAEAIPTSPHQGRCLCGAVGLSVKAKSRNISLCHCTMCRTWSGGPMLAVECEGDVAFEGGEHITVYNSSAWAERGFCRICGTHLFYRSKSTELYEIPVGLLGDDAPWVLAQQIFIDEKPAFYGFANETKMMTGAEVFALFAPPAP